MKSVQKQIWNNTCYSQSKYWLAPRSQMYYKLHPQITMSLYREIHSICHKKPISLEDAAMRQIFNNVVLWK